MKYFGVFTLSAWYEGTRTATITWEGEVEGSSYVSAYYKAKNLAILRLQNCRKDSSSDLIVVFYSLVEIRA